MRDRVVAGGLFLGTIALLWAGPRNLGHSDEAYHLYHAVRVLHGEALYRDVFDHYAPLFTDVMALAFRVFGIDMGVARLVDALLHGVLAVLLYAVARRTGAGPGAALVLPAAHLTLFRSVWPYGSAHWLSTTVTVGLLLASLDRVQARRPARMFLQGVLLGTLGMVVHARAVPVAIGVCALVGADVLLDRRYGRVPGAAPAIRLIALAAGTASVVGPLLLGHAWQAGVDPVIEQLVRYPFAGYRAYNRNVGWGASLATATLAASTWVPVVVSLPLVGPLGAVCLVRAWWARTERGALERLAVLTAFACSATLGVLYHPDIVHLAFVAPVQAALALDLVGRAGRRVRMAPVVGAAMVAVCLASLGLQMRRNHQQAVAAFPFRTDTVFGRVDLGSRREQEFVDTVRVRLRAAGTTEVFCYPVFASLYLMAGAENPTRHDLIMPRFQSEAELQAVIDTLERRRTPFVVLIDALIGPRDPVAAYVRRRYRCAAGLCERIADPPQQMP